MSCEDIGVMKVDTHQIACMESYFRQLRFFDIKVL